METARKRLEEENEEIQHMKESEGGRMIAGHSGPCLQSQHFGRPRKEDHLSPGVPDQPG